MRIEEEEVISAPERKRPDPSTLRQMLLNLIHTFYLEALARLPASRLWSKHARGVLVAGHCYGPLSPVDDILVNAIWYDTAFPRCPTAEFHSGDVLEISHRCMSRIAHRSLEGLVACLLHLCPSLSRDDALWHLHLSKANLSHAIASVSDSALAPTDAAYLAAAEAAHHPVPCAMAHFASSVLPTVEDDAGMLLRLNQVLSARCLDRLSAMLVPSPIPEDLCPPPPLITTWVAAIIKQTGQHYELHFMCRLHMFISSGAYWHINFLARRKDAAGELPICFFAEATVPMGEDDKFHEEDIILCCPVKPSTIGGCKPCTDHCIRINHPIDKEHHGGLQDKDDGKIWNGDNHRAYEFLQLVDFIMFDADRDCATVRAVEKSFPRRSDGDESVENIWIAEM